MTGYAKSTELEAAVVSALALADRIGAHIAAIHLSAALDAIQGNNGPWKEKDVLAAIEAAAAQHHFI